MNKADISIEFCILLGLCNNCEIKYNENIKVARTLEGEPPVKIVYPIRQAIMMIYFTIRDFPLFDRNKDNKKLIKANNIPTCKPDTARI